MAHPLGCTPTTIILGQPILAVGTREKVYVLYDNTWTDITPVGFVNDASNDPLGYGAYHYNVEDYGDARSQSGLPLDIRSFFF